MRSISRMGDSIRANQVIAVIESPETTSNIRPRSPMPIIWNSSPTGCATLVKKEVISQQDADQAAADAAAVSRRT